MQITRDSFSIRNLISITKTSESSKVLSGMLLYHCLIYGLSEVDGDQPTTLPDPSGPNDIAVLVFKFSPKTVLNKSQVLFANLPGYLRVGTAKPSMDHILWLHLTSKSSLPQIIEHFRLPPVLLTIFSDSTVFARTHHLGSRGSVIQLITVNMQDDIINLKKLHIFIMTGLVLTFEQRSHAVIDEKNTQSYEHYSVPVNPLGLTRGTSLTVGSELNLDASDGGFSMDKISGTFLSHIISRIDREDIYQNICSQGVGYLLAELVRAMLSIAYPVIRMHSKEMLTLHDKVFLREKKPDYHEGSFYLDQIAIFRLSYKLLLLVLQETHELVDKLSGKGDSPIMDDVNAIPIDQRADLEFAYHRAIMQTQRLQSELDRIHTNLRDLITRRNDRVNLMLTMTATTFLPLTFITGKRLALCRLMANFYDLI
jgi:Mg2+ and Co2+ transporter CorA